MVVGVNRFQTRTTRRLELQRIDEGDRAAGRAAPELRASRDAGAVEAALAEVETAARGTGNLLPPMKEALRARATLGEVSDVLRGGVRRVPARRY